jgi:Trk K+ transport system NAD-binding subunit
MKFLASQLAFFFQNRTTQRNIRLLASFLLMLAAIITFYSVLFHFIMLLEDRDYSMITGFYWTLTVMSTLGFGDITFTSDAGKIFSIIVLMSGILLLLVVLPFTFIQFFYAPWLEAQSRARAPRELPETTSNHIIITNLDLVTSQLIERLKQYHYEYAILVEDAARAIELYDQDFRVMVGANDDPATYQKLRIEHATMVVATNDDMTNTNITFTIREKNTKIPIVTNADSDDSIDILTLAGATHTLQFMKMLGQSLARRILGVNTGANIISRFDSLLIAEAPAMRTPLEGKTLMESRLRETSGLTVVGIWDRGFFQIPRPDTRLSATSVLLLAGSANQIEAYEKKFGFYHATPPLVVIIGGGRVGRAAAQVLDRRGINYHIVEKNPKLADSQDRYVHGSAADFQTLERAGIREATSVIITTHNDSLNIYLTNYCRGLRPDIQIICRATLERNISTLHRAGADLVMSHATMAANTILNLLKPNDIVMLAEGLNIFRMPLHPGLKGKTLAETQIRKHTGCSVVAIRANQQLVINPDPVRPFQTDDELILIGMDNSDCLKYYDKLSRKQADRFARYRSRLFSRTQKQ